MGEGEGSSAETKAHDLSSRQKEDRGGTASEVGEGEGAAEEGYLGPAEPAARPQTRCPTRLGQSDNIQHRGKK